MSHSSPHATTGETSETSTAETPDTADTTALAPAETDRFAYGGQSAASLVTDRWRAASASVTGPSHARKDKPCEDAAAAGTRGEWFVAAVCDGAGSARLGGRGAEMAAARIVAEMLARAGDLESDAAPGEAAIEAFVVGALTAAREHMVEVAKAESVLIQALSATVVGAAWRDDLTILFHIGDGAAVALAGSGDLLAASTGDEQEYANETYFLTDSSWRKWLRIQTVSGVESLLLMTDGVTPFALELKTPKVPFIGPVLEFLRANDVDRGALALQRLLDKAEARAIQDDKTFLWAQRVIPPVGETHAADTAVDTAELDR